MTTLQEQFERDFSDKSVREIDAKRKYQDSNFTNYDLDLREYKDVEKFNLTGNKITSVSLSGCKELKELNLFGNRLTSVDFLNTIPSPEKLEELVIGHNRIGGDLKMFSKFVNLKELRIGNPFGVKGNCFHGSLEPLKNLTKLEMICIEATNV